MKKEFNLNELSPGALVLCQGKNQPINIIDFVIDHNTTLVYRRYNNTLELYSSTNYTYRSVFWKVKFVS